MPRHPMTPEHAQALIDITQTTIYLMGISFILGSLFTVFTLLVLDFIRRDKTNHNDQA